ncbi:Protein involved in meta-pathway of phenol degradation [Salinisphaera sp. LB1]|nr:Protein involved in meta-pathway of phenol degradation [Salinisphaera sp. LB1]
MLAGMSVAPRAHATEDGQTHYPVGVNTLGDGYMPMPGTLEFRNYTVGHWSHTLANSSGNESVPGFSNSGAVDAMRVLYTFAQPIGPFHYAMGGVLEFSYNHLDVGSESDEATNLGDLDFQNYLSYHTPDKKMFLYFGVDTYLPTGRYNKSDLVNPGKNYWSFDPSINVTYHVSDKLALNGAVYGEFNTENSATDYQSGDSVDLDYGVNYRPFVHQSTDHFVQHLGFGIGGYYLKQFTDDQINGHSVAPDGHRAQAVGVGPQVIYYTQFGGLALKYQHDLAVENRAASDTVWLQFAIPVWGSFRRVEHN